MVLPDASGTSSVVPRAAVAARASRTTARRRCARAIPAVIMASARPRIKVSAIPARKIARLFMVVIRLPNTATVYSGPPERLSAISTPMNAPVAARRSRPSSSMVATFL